MRWLLNVMRKASNTHLWLGKKDETRQEILDLVKKIECYQKQLKMYKIFWDCTSAGLALVRISDGKILDVNPAMCSIYGYTHDEAIGGLTIFDIAVDKGRMRVVLDERVPNVRYRWHKKKDGGKICISAQMTYLNDHGYDVVAASIRERSDCEEHDVEQSC